MQPRWSITLWHELSRLCRTDCDFFDDRQFLRILSRPGDQTAGGGIALPVPNNAALQTVSATTRDNGIGHARRP